MNQPATRTTPLKGTWRTYSLAEGLAGIQVEHITADREGYLWIATWDSGVSRFDGDEFRTYTRSSGLCGNQVMAAFRDSQDRLWFGTRDGGTCFHDGRNFHRFTGNDGVSNGSISYITEDREGRIWFGGDQTVGYLQDDRFHDLHPEYLCSLQGVGDRSDFRGCYGIAQDRAGHIWFASNTLYRYDGHAFDHFGPAAGLPRTRWSYSLAIDQDDDLWVGGGQMVGRFTDGAFDPAPVDSNGAMRKIYVDPDGEVWICTSGAGVIHYDGTDYEQFRVQDGLAYDVVNTAFADREGHMWFGTWGGGLNCWAPRSMQVMSAEDDTLLEEVNALHEDRNGHLWMGAAPYLAPKEKTLVHYDGARIRGLGDAPDLGRCWALCADGRGDLYIGGDLGLLHYDGEAFSALGPDDHTASALAIDRQGYLLVGHWSAQEGTVQISRYDGTRFDPLYTDDEVLAEDCITALIISRQDELWFGRGTMLSKDRGKGVGCLRPGTGLTFFTTADGLVDDRVEDLLEDRHGNLWIATLGGLSYFDGIRFRNFTIESGLPNNRIRCLYEDRAGHLWLGTDSGVVRYNGQHFQTIRSPQLSSVTSIIEDHDGYFWFAALHHVVRYAPSAIPPRCRVIRMIADQIYQDVERVELATEVRQIIFEFKGISFRTHPKDMLYTHRLRGYEDEWQLADGAEMRAYYQDLPPGEYAFEVRAIDRDFNSSAAAALALKIDPDPRLGLLAGDDAREVETFIGHSAALRQTLSQIREVAETDLTVLALGETGTGKGLVARTLHRLSKRHDRPLIQVNCGALPSGLIESELFGHEKGAFTSAVSRKPGKVELAQGGTLFLDEVGDLALEAQVKLLRLLEEQTFERVGGTETFRADVRVVAATNRDLQQMVAGGSFREDLYFRLQVFPLQLPPLRDRREDIPQLATYFMERMAAHLDKNVTSLSPDAIAVLQAYDWPGNVRELEHSVQRSVIVCRGAAIRADDIALEVARADGPQQSSTLTLEENERRHILAVLEQTGWVVKGPDGAAGLLDLPSSTLRSRMKKLGIERPKG